MDCEQAKILGEKIRGRREELRLSSTQLAASTGMNQASVVRLEKGRFLNPDPEKLRAIAEALGLNLADVLSSAGYPIPTELPSVGVYLRTKYRDLSAQEVDEIQDQVMAMLRRHGIGPSAGPLNGEDELPEAPRPPHSGTDNVTKGGNSP